ncbi:MAG TPA: hypothetical protein VGF86_03970 [Candidatus Tumulicola sp.]
MSSHNERDVAVEELLYVVDSDRLLMYAYRNGRAKPFAQIAGIEYSSDLCADAGGNVFVVDESGRQIVEYAHGATSPLETFDDKIGPPIGCAADPVTGNLAVVNSYDGHYKSASVLVFTPGSALPKRYGEKRIWRLEACAYDDKGDLFVFALSRSESPYLIELPSGGSNLVDLEIKGVSLTTFGGMQWRGRYLVIGSTQYAGPYRSVLYEFAVDGKVAMHKRTIRLQHSGDVSNFVLQGDRVIAPDGDEYLPIFAYPSGALVSVITKGLGRPTAVTLSEPPERL